MESQNILRLFSVFGMSYSPRTCQALPPLANGETRLQSGLVLAALGPFSIFPDPIVVLKVSKKPAEIQTARFHLNGDIV